MFVVNVDWFFISHRIFIADELLKQGYKITLVAKNTGKKNEIIKRGINFIDLDISRSGKFLFSELLVLFKLFIIYTSVKPNIIHHVTLKPVIYGSIIARFLKISNVVNSISGLGYVFTSQRKGIFYKLIIYLMRFGFKSKKMSIIFQNNDDFRELSFLKIINSRNLLFWIKGSGVDLNYFKCNSFPEFNKIIILFPTRMLLDKGVKELYEASVILKQKYYNKIQFVLAGMIDEENPAGVTKEFLSDWHDGNYVNWIGFQNNMVDLYKNSHIVVLPSYREGMPKTLIEACSMGRAIITTDAIGCRECVDENINGLKVPIMDSCSLAFAIENLLNNKVKIIEMGKNSRLKAEREFDFRFVLEKHLNIYSQYK